jgi:hypothetical protein
LPKAVAWGRRSAGQRGRTVRDALTRTFGKSSLSGVTGSSRIRLRLSDGLVHDRGRNTNHRDLADALDREQMTYGSFSSTKITFVVLGASPLTGTPYSARFACLTSGDVESRERS